MVLGHDWLLNIGFACTRSTPQPPLLTTRPFPQESYSAVCLKAKAARTTSVVSHTNGVLDCYSFFFQDVYTSLSHA